MWWWVISLFWFLLFSMYESLQLHVAVKMHINYRYFTFITVLTTTTTRYLNFSQSTWRQNTLTDFNAKWRGKRVSKRAKTCVRCYFFTFRPFLGNIRPILSWTIVASKVNTLDFFSKAQETHFTALRSGPHFQSRIFQPCICDGPLFFLVLHFQSPLVDTLSLKYIWVATWSWVLHDIIGHVTSRFAIVNFL